MGSYAERTRHLDTAQAAMLRGAAALGELRTTETITFAVLECAFALVSLAKADGDGAVVDGVLLALASAKARPAAPKEEP